MNQVLFQFSQKSDYEKLMRLLNMQGFLWKDGSKPEEEKDVPIVATYTTEKISKKTGKLAKISKSIFIENKDGKKEKFILGTKKERYIFNIFDTQNEEHRRINDYNENLEKGEKMKEENPDLEPILRIDIDNKMIEWGGKWHWKKNGYTEEDFKEFKI